MRLVVCLQAVLDAALNATQPRPLEAVVNLLQAHFFCLKSLASRLVRVWLSLLLTPRLALFAPLLTRFTPPTVLGLPSIMPFWEKSPAEKEYVTHSPDGHDGHDIVNFQNGEIAENADNLQRRLNNRQIQLIAIGGSIGTALFVSIGGGLHQGGPGSLFVSAKSITRTVSATIY